MPGMNEWDVSTAQLQKTHGYAARTDYHKDFEQARKAGELAREIMRLARSTLLIHMRFMESALVRLAHGDETVTAEMATDGRFLYYNSLHVCRSFKRESSLPARDYMHLTLHCVFRHMFIGKGVNTDLWDLACDIAAESIINSLNIKALYASRQEKQGWLIRKLRDELPRFTAERIYRWLIDQELPEQEIGRIRSYFYADDHRMWYNPAEEMRGGGNGERTERRDSRHRAGYGRHERRRRLSPPRPRTGKGRNRAHPAGATPASAEIQATRARGMSGRENQEMGDKKAMSPQETERMWKDISERIQVDLDTASNSFGESAGDFVAALGEVNREKVDYAAFLRRFAVLGENVQINDDEFDYVFYTYGMKLYGRMPLIEPLEYKEVKRVREFVHSAGHLRVRLRARLVPDLRKQDVEHTQADGQLLHQGKRPHHPVRRKGRRGRAHNQSGRV